MFEQLRKDACQPVIAFIEILASTGLRRSEALALNWSDFDFEKRFIHTKRSRNSKAFSAKD
jgi:integrase